MKRPEELRRDIETAAGLGVFEGRFKRVAQRREQNPPPVLEAVCECLVPKRLARDGEIPAESVTITRLALEPMLHVSGGPGRYDVRIYAAECPECGVVYWARWEWYAYARR